MEIWKIINHPNLTNYEISSYGNIRNNKTKRPITINNRKDGYSTLSINKKSYSVHRLVALTFIENPHNKLTVNHIDKNKHNNNVNNLEWATYKEQYLHSATIHKNNNKGVWKVDPETNKKIQYYSTIKLAGLDINGTENSFKNISTCARGLIYTAYGFKWIYEKHTDLDNEVWKSIVFEGKLRQTYNVSNYGRVKNGSRLLKLRIDNNGYYTIHSKAVHRLVASAFIPNPYNYSIVNHKDGNKLNNNIDNLEWTTLSGNAIHSVNIGLRKNVLIIEQIDDNGNVIDTFNSCLQAEKKLNVNGRSINKCCKGKIKSCGPNKFKFRYKDESYYNNVVQNKKEITKQKRKRPINIYNRNNVLIDSCATIVETTKKYNVNSKTIVAHCNGDVKYPNLDYYFRYK